MNDYIIYINKLELIAFFGAFPLFYFLIFSISEIPFIRKHQWLKILPNKIPTISAILSILYLGMKLNQLYIHYENNIPIQFNFHIIFCLQYWALLGLLFLFSPFRSNPILALWHSIPFTFIILIDFVKYFLHIVNVEVVHNEMQIYFIGFISNVIILFLLISYPFLKSKLRTLW